jgi:hypothetical protein
MEDAMITNSLLAEPQGPTPLIPKPATGHDPEPVPSTPILTTYFPKTYLSKFWASINTGSFLDSFIAL